MSNPTVPVGPDAIAESMSDQDMELVDSFPITQSPGAALADAQRRRSAAPIEVPKFELEVDPGEDAVVLIEQDGVYTWHHSSPTTPNPAMRGTPTRRIATIPIDLDRGRATPPPASKQRSKVGEAIWGAARAFVFRFLARVVASGASRMLERNVQTGVVRLRGDNTSAWARVASPTDLKLPTDRPARLLCFFHGTFSSTIGSFGALTGTAWGRDFLTSANDAYDAIIGFDHRTLGQDPAQNAQEILAFLEKTTGNVVCDAIAYSRGALVFRSLDRQLAQAGLADRIRFERAIFVGPANGGTQLAHAQNWQNLADLYTTISAAGARTLGLITGMPVTGKILSEAIKSVGEFVKALALSSLKAQDIPGLAAMEPDGPFIQSLNAPPIDPGKPSSRFNGVISAEFDNSFLPQSEKDAGASEISSNLARWLAKGFMRKLMGEASDLVVNVAAMSMMGPEAVSDSFAYGPTPHVFHTNYFTRPETAGTMSRWLGLKLPPGAGVPDQPERASSTQLRTVHDALVARRSAKPIQRRGRGAGGASRGVRTPTDAKESMPIDAWGLSLGMGGGSGGISDTPEPAPSASPPPNTTGQCFFQASMDDVVQVGKQVPLEVVLSREELAQLSSPGTATTAANINLVRKISVLVFGRQNFNVIGPDRGRWEGDPPLPAAPLRLTFVVEALEPGPGEVQVYFMQGPAQLARICLNPTISATRPRTTLRSVAKVARPRSPGPIESIPRLQILERKVGNRVHYDFNFILGDDKTLVFEEGKPIVALKKYVESLYTQIEEMWSENQKDHVAFSNALRAFGGSLFSKLVPSRIQKKLWELRDSVRGLIVYAYEPLVPWELAFLKPPAADGAISPPAPEDSRFLGELGITRWLQTDDDNNPPLLIKVRNGRSVYVIPDYPHPAWKLPRAQEEATFLKQRFGAKEVAGEAADVDATLKSAGALDLFHFAGHGFAEVGSATAQIMMTGLVKGGKYQPRYYNSTTVEQNPLLEGKDGNRPIVVLNACQIGRVGYQLTGFGGFSQAFVSRRAGAFVGTLWSVGDEPAHVFTEALYDALLNGDVLAEATRKARAKARDAADPTWMAYTVYGHPSMRLVKES